MNLEAMKVAGTIRAKRAARVFRAGKGLPSSMRCVVSVISHGRSRNVREVESLIGRARWYVGEGEADEYRGAGADYVKEAGGLCASRNAALDDAHLHGMVSIQVSDDLRGIARLRIDGEKKRAIPCTFRKAVRDVLAAMKKVGARIGGVAPTANPFYASERIAQDKFVVADLVAVAPCQLRFDVRMRLKEDYDYTLQHLREYGTVARCDWILARFLHRENEGGAVSYRTSAMERRMIDRLRKKWGDAIRHNPRRKDEVLLRWRNEKP